MPELVAQQSVAGNGQRVEEWTIELKSANDFTARQRARAYVRRVAPQAMNILSPEVVSSETTEQATFSDIFPEDFGREMHRVEVTVVLPGR